jgi:rSAM/selenodomain-associated transferase 1
MKETIAVIIMAKYPTPGRVKTRLMPTLTAAQAARVHRVFLEHLAYRIDQMQWGELIVSHDPPDCMGEMRDIVGQQAMAGYGPQVGKDLGERLANAIGGVDGDLTKVLFLGVDSPDVPDSHLLRVAELLRLHDVVIAPADDGGFWSVALNTRVDAVRLFDNIEWSSGREFAQVLERAPALGYNVAVADRWADVDRPADLRSLLERLRSSDAPDDRELLARLSFLPEGVV